MRRCIAWALLIVPALASSQPWSPPVDSDLKFDDLFPRLPFFGKTARSIEWSEDDRYFGYLWNPYEVRSADLWIFDTSSGKSRQLTSLELMSEFDTDAKKAAERYRKEDRDRDERLKLDEKSYRETMIKLRKEEEQRKEPLPNYPGISEYAWSHKGHELMFVYKGDLFRWKLDDKKPVRLTKTRDTEGDVKWMPDDSGFYFRRGEGLYMMKFDGAYVEQLNPKLPDNLPFQGYSLSPDGTKMMLYVEKSGTYKQIEWMTYKNRFGQVRRQNQALGTSDEKLQEERHLFLFDLTKGQDEKPWKVWSWKSEGDELKDVSFSDEPWSPDSKRFAFASYDTLSREIELQMADIGAQKLESVHKTTFPGESSSAVQCSPIWTPDGKGIVAQFETTGWRLPWLVDPLTKTARALCQGEFEAYPVKITADGKSLIAHSTALDPARSQVYRVDMASGAMKRITQETGDYGMPRVSHKGGVMAVTFKNWSRPVETYVVSEGRQSQLTKSHREGGFEKVNKLKPELFTFKNRNGQTVHGFVFLPPGFKKDDKRPCMVYTYGGPLGNGNTVADGSFGSTEYLLNMYLAYAMGYVAVAIDPRGSSGYGAAFVRASFGHVGEVQSQDLVDCAKYCQSEWGVDPKKMALNGWSFGGWQTQYTMYHDPDVFTLGIAGAGPTEWQNYNQWYSQETIAIQPEGKVDELDKFSLTKVAMNLKHPLLLLHGMDDDNVLFVHTVNVYRVLCQYGLAPLVELVLDPTGSHGLGGDLNRRDTLAIYVEFLIKHWGNPKPKI